LHPWTDKTRRFRSNSIVTYAVIRTGGKQYRVSTGTVLTVEKLAGQPGDAVEFTEVLARGEGAQLEVGTPIIAGARVTGVIVRQDRGPRVLVYKKKRRKNYRRRHGHRQYETTVQVTEIG
jgi:large subunit ribosomal protein L21